MIVFVGDGDGWMCGRMHAIIEALSIFQSSCVLLEYVFLLLIFLKTSSTSYLCDVGH